MLALLLVISMLAGLGWQSPALGQGIGAEPTCADLNNDINSGDMTLISRYIFSLVRQFEMARIGRGCEPVFGHSLAPDLERQEFLSSVQKYCYSYNGGSLFDRVWGAYSLKQEQFDAVAAIGGQQRRCQ